MIDTNTQLEKLYQKLESLKQEFNLVGIRWNELSDEITDINVAIRHEKQVRGPND